MHERGLLPTQPRFTADSGGEHSHRLTDGRIAEDPLADFILDDRLRQRVILACHHCQKPKDVSERVLFLLRQSPIWNSRVMLGKPFLQALLPHLTGMAGKVSVRSLYDAVLYNS